MFLIGIDVNESELSTVKGTLLLFQNMERYQNLKYVTQRYSRKGARRIVQKKN
jgi:hypothetical protein